MPMKSLIAEAMRLAVVKSGLRSASRTCIEPVQRELDLALDDGAVGDAADGRHAARDLGGFALAPGSRPIASEPWPTA